MKPNIYECKLCQEHHCEHDFPEDSVHEMSSIIQANPIVLQSPPAKCNQSPKAHRTEEKPINGQGLISEKPSCSKGFSDVKESRK